MRRPDPDVSGAPQLDAALSELLRTTLKPAPGPFSLENARSGSQHVASALSGTPMAVASTTDLRAGATEVPVRVYLPRLTLPAATIVYFHGGGWVTGDLDQYDAVCRALCAGSGAVVVSTGFRLAPEHPYPAPLEDCLTVARWAGDRIAALGADPRRLVVCGDSVGGGMAAVVARRLVREGRPVALQVLLYPATDAAMRTASYATFGGGEYYVSTATMRAYWDAYLAGGTDPADPDVSPLRAPDLAGLPPAIVLLAGFDPLCDEGQAYAERLRAAGVPVTQIDVPGATHAFLRFRTLPLARHVMADVALRIAALTARADGRGFVAVVSRLAAKPGCERALTDICAALGPLSIAEPGSLSYQFHHEPGEPSRFAFYEAFRTPTDLQAHLDAPHTQAWFRRIAELTEGPPEITRLEVLDAPVKPAAIPAVAAASASPLPPPPARSKP